MMRDMPLVSVIIPTFNRAARVVKSIESVLGQTYPFIQLIVVDDGSSDNTRERVEMLDGVEYYRLAENSGQAAARNAGLSYAKGELVASLDSDDYWTPVFLEKCVGKLLGEDLDFVFTNWHQAQQSGEWMDFLSRDPYLKPFLTHLGNEQWYSLAGNQLRALYLKACPSPSSSVVMRRSSIVSGWNHQLNIGDDWCLYLDMILSKDCKAAFTLQQLWYKDIDGLNIYDGRARSEVVKLLLIDDTKLVLERYRHTLNNDERRVLANRHVAGLVEYAKHLALRDRKLEKALDIFGQAFKLNTAYSLVMIVKVLYDGFSNHIIGFWTNRRNKLGVKSARAIG